MLIDDENIRFGYLHGIDFQFSDHENVIDARFAPISGGEQIFLNGDLVSEGNTYSLSSSHEFSDGIRCYVVSIVMNNLIKGAFSCKLLRDSETVREYRVTRTTTKRFSIGWIFLVGVLLGAAISLFNLDRWDTLVIAFPFLMALSLFSSRRRWVYSVAP